MNNRSTAFVSPVWIVIPAAGVGTRMGAACPKQYLPLAGATVLQITLQKMLTLPEITGVVVAVSDDDTAWHGLEIANHPMIHRVSGGKERADSVMNALIYLQQQNVPSDHWILVHDAARPCVQLPMIEQLRLQVEQAASDGTASGGILAKPVADTLKRVEASRITDTEDRRDLWQAHTPQMFRLQSLQQCLQLAQDQQLPVTDEASAMEYQGVHCLVVDDRRDNIKITHAEDLLLAEMILQQQAAENPAGQHPHEINQQESRE